jgi:hypothetical protein
VVVLAWLVLNFQLTFSYQQTGSRKFRIIKLLCLAICQQRLNLIYNDFVNFVVGLCGKLETGQTVVFIQGTVAAECVGAGIFASVVYLDQDIGWFQ